MNDAVNATSGFPFRSYAVVPNIPGPASGDEAVAAAGRNTLIALFPARGADIDASAKFYKRLFKWFELA